MIERIYAENYRAFEHIDIDFSKINLFFGPNNSGKSSVLSILNLLSQTLLSSDQSVPLLLSGVKEDLGNFRDLVFNHDVDKQIKIGIQTRHDLGLSPKLMGFNPRKSNNSEITGIIELIFEFRPRRHEIILVNINIKILEYGYEAKFERSRSYNSDSYFMTYYNDGEIESYTRKKVDYMIHFLPHFYAHPNRTFQRIMRRFYLKFAKEIKSIEFIGPFREPPQRTYMFSGENSDSVGVRGERAIDILTMDHLKQIGGAKKRNIADKVSKWYKSCEISEKLSINTLSDRHYEIVLTHIQSKSAENIADVGYGCSQVLPILVAGHSLNNGRILLIQEPEIHLHPRAQSELGSFFYDICSEGIQAIIETHSEHLLLRLQAHVADKTINLNPKDVNIYYIFAENGEKKCKKLELKDDGFFRDPWPKGFFPERYEEAKKIAMGSLVS